MRNKVHVYIICWNEIDILPFCVDYWKCFAERVIVYDNGSDDGTLEFLDKFKPWIEVRHFDSEGVDNEAYLRIKNNVWKESRGKADFVSVGDTDELLFSPVLDEELDYMKDNNMTICGPRQYSLLGESFPQYEDGKLIHELVQRARLQPSNHTYKNVSGKIMLFNPNEIEEINYKPGCHYTDIKGNVKLYDGNKIFCIHTNKGFGADYRIARYRQLQKRRSPNDIKKGYGIHFTHTDDKIRSDYNKGINESVNFMDVLKETFN